MVVRLHLGTGSLFIRGAWHKRLHRSRILHPVLSTHLATIWTPIWEPSATGATQLQLGLKEIAASRFQRSAIVRARDFRAPPEAGMTPRDWRSIGRSLADQWQVLRRRLTPPTVVRPLSASATGATRYQPAATPEETPIHTIRQRRRRDSMLPTRLFDSFGNNEHLPVKEASHGSEFNNSGRRMR